MGGEDSIETVVTYLEMRVPPERTLPPPRPDLALARLEPPTLSLYRWLYETVGAPWLWTERRLMDDNALAAIVRDPQVEVYLLGAAGEPAGFVELDRRTPGEVQLAYFGLLPAFIGQGLGRHLLEQAIALAFRDGPTRLWVHTCTLDHPRALPLYLAVGFRPYAERIERVALPAGIVAAAGQAGAGTGRGA